MSCASPLIDDTVDIVAASGRTACRIDWVMNDLRWSDLFYNLADGTPHAEAVRQAEMRLPLVRRGFRTDEHTFGYQIVGCADSPARRLEYPFGDA
jgi:hypothetical protein